MLPADILSAVTSGWVALFRPHRLDIYVALIIAYVRWGTDFHVIVKELRTVRRHSDTTMRCGISWQNPHMHPNAFSSEPHKPPHWRAHIMCSAGGGIDFGADARADSATRVVNKVAINAGTVIRILFHDGEMARG